MHILKAIAKVCCDIADEEVDSYWITKRFFEMQDKFVDQYSKLVSLCLHFEEVIYDLFINLLRKKILLL